MRVDWGRRQSLNFTLLVLGPRLGKSHGTTAHGGGPGAGGEGEEIEDYKAPERATDPISGQECGPPALALRRRKEGGGSRYYKK